MRSLIIAFGIGLAAIVTGDGTLAQNNTFVLRQGAPPRIAPVLVPGYPVPGTPGYPTPGIQGRMPDGRYVFTTPSPLIQPSPVPGYPVPGTPGYPTPGIHGR
jgi:hypothetical protein